MNIENNETCFVGLWQELEATKQQIEGSWCRFTVSNLVRQWWPMVEQARQQRPELPPADRTELCWLIAQKAEVGCLDLLPAPQLEPRVSRKILQVIIAYALGIGLNAVRLKALDHAYHTALPHGRRLNIGKHRAA